MGIPAAENQSLVLIGLSRFSFRFGALVVLATPLRSVAVTIVGGLVGLVLAALDQSMPLLI